MIVSPDVTGNVDPIVMNIVRAINTDATIVPITKLNDFKFDESLYNLDKYVLVDFIENHWNWDMADTLLFGNNRDRFDYLVGGEEWKKFDDFVKAKPPAIYFKRELLKKDVTENILTIGVMVF